jgi:peptide/nickel transport system substrate-binding protein
MAFNVVAPPFDNKKLRHAVAHAIDKREILHAGYYGFGEPADQKYPRGAAWYIEGLPSPAYDPERARALLREAGYDGRPLVFIVEQGSELQAAATTLQAQLKRVGVEVRLETQEYSAYVARQRRGEFDFVIGGAGHFADPSATYAPDLRCEPDRTRRASNQPGYCDPEMDALLERAESELDPARRKALFHQVVTKVADDLPELYIGFVPRYFTFRDHVKGFTSDYEGRFMHAEGGLSGTWIDR